MFAGRKEGQMSVEGPVGHELVSFVGTGEGVASQVEHAIHRIVMHHLEIPGPLLGRPGHKMEVSGLDFEARQMGRAVERSNEVGSLDAENLEVVEYREERDWPQ
jgi:hypothetical protein